MNSIHGTLGGAADQMPQTSKNRAGGAIFEARDLAYTANIFANNLRHINIVQQSFAEEYCQHGDNHVPRHKYHICESLGHAFA